MSCYCLLIWRPAAHIVDWIGCLHLLMSFSCCVQTLQATLTSVSDSVSSVPDVSTYISSLTPAVSAYNALPANVFTQLEGSLTSIDTDITQVYDVFSVT
jgi:hypothetical protein